MSDRKILLPDEGVVCRGPDGIILTTDGWIARIQRHKHDGITQLFRMIHVKDLESIAPPITSKWRSVMRAFLFASIMVASLALFYSPFSYGMETFLDGFDPNLCTERDDGIWNCPRDSWMNDYYIWPWAAWLPLALGVLGFMIPFGATLELQHSSGTMKIEQESVVSAWNYYVVGGLWWLFLTPEPAWGFSHFLSEGGWIIPVAILVLIFYKISQRELSTHSDEDQRGPEIRDVGLHQFHRNLLTAFDLPRNEQGRQEILSLGEKMGGDLSAVRRRLEEHDAMLAQIAIHSPHIFVSPAPWLGITAIGACTEVLLGHRVRQILPKPSKGLRTLANYRDQLKKYDRGVDQKTLSSIGVILSLRNNAIHGGMDATMHEFGSALQKFLEIVEWHESTPAKSVVET